ncbi:MAG TPA: ABC-three component system protein [Xanthobacteraceae bacterium]|nr:ABC-three component system protein [Xanthobacteraceae bacterium]
MNIVTQEATITNQQGAQAGGSIIGRDYNNFEAKKGVVEKLLLKLKQQYECNEQTQTTMDELVRYHTRRAADGIDGLEAKLKASGLLDYYDEAIEKKEMFAKLLERWSLYSSAQQIFVHILARAENEFTQVIYRQIPQRTPEEINALVIDRIVNPIVEECGGELMLVNHNLVQGMVYWLAEQCFIKWHHAAVAV